ncbi:MAG: hypothetical protein ABEJ68_02845 [Halobacteriaceae archaeon]
MADESGAALTRRGVVSGAVAALAGCAALDGESRPDAVPLTMYSSSSERQRVTVTLTTPDGDTDFERHVTLDPDEARKWTIQDPASEYEVRVALDGGPTKTATWDVGHCVSRFSIALFPENSDEAISFGAPAC